MKSRAVAAPEKFSVLVLDDDPAMLETTLATIDDVHDAFGTTSPSEALEVLVKRPFHVVVSDWMMPGMDGVTFFRRVALLDRAVACLLVSGRIEELGVTVDYEERKLFMSLAKPFSREQLLSRIDSLGKLAKMRQSVKKLRSKD